MWSDLDARTKPNLPNPLSSDETKTKQQRQYIQSWRQAICSTDRYVSRLKARFKETTIIEISENSAEEKGKKKKVTKIIQHLVVIY